jgi:sortase B
MSDNKKNKNKMISYIGLTVACLAVLTLILFGVIHLVRNHQNEEELRKIREARDKQTEIGPIANVTKGPEITPTPVTNENEGNNGPATPTFTPAPTTTPTPRPIAIQSGFMMDLYEYNSDVVGYLLMRNTFGVEIDYPVMQTFDNPNTPENEMEYYINRGVDKAPLKRGSLFMDQNSISGVGYKEDNYVGGEEPSDILLIYGHNMADGTMFGYLYKFLETEYAKEHLYIDYDTLYEHRVYKVISCFRSHVFTSADRMDYSNYDDPKFKYYAFKGNMTEEEFVYWYANVMSHNENELPEFNASYGDEFMVLSTCSPTDETGRKNENGRVCLVAVRVE